MKNGMKKTAIGTALWATLFLTMGVSLSACSSDKEEAGAESGEVLAKDKVDEASELARANAPEAEDMDFPETTPMPADTAEGLEGGATGTDNAVAEDGAATDAAGDMATTSADTDAATTDSAAATVTDAAAMTTDTTEPATN